MDALHRRDGSRGTRLLICAGATALLMVMPALPAGAVASNETDATSAAARCAKGQERVKLRVGGKSRSRCVKKCKAGYVRKFTNRTAKTKCVRKPAVAPPGTTAPAPGATTAPVDSRERARQLLRHRVLTYYKGSTNGSSSTQKSVTLCGDMTFGYFYRYDSSGAAGSVGNEARAGGTWDVDEAEFNDAAGTMRAIVSYKSDNQTALEDGRMLVEAMGEKVWVDAEEWGYTTASC
jgi:hypothetical protein